MTDAYDAVSRRAVCIAALLAGGLGSARAEQVEIQASRDNTLYQNASGTVSNGAGQHFFAGFTGIFDQTIRRGLIAFDIAAHVPEGSTIDSVTLTLSMSMTNISSGNQPVDLHRVLADWGEGTSDALANEGVGTAATPGDATWLHRFFDTDFWASPGGDFSSTISAGRMVGEVGFYTWGPTAQMRDDVQSWLDAPSVNFGWLLRGNEGVIASAKRFDSRENPIPANRPVLVVLFTRPPPDFDGDGDVDLDDYEEFYLCLSGPGGGLGDGCKPGDSDADDDIDLSDFSFFQQRFGPGV